MSRAVAIALVLAACGSSGSKSKAKDAGVVAIVPKDADPAPPDAAPPVEDQPEVPGDPWIDRTLADGTLAATLQLGLARTPAPGVTLHLVSIAVDGSATDTAYTTDATGAIMVSGLVHDGTVAYHLLGELNGDRIECQPIVMPRLGGARVELFAREPGSTDRPWPGLPDADVDVPADQVWLSVMGSADAKDATLVPVGTGATITSTASVAGQLGPTIGFKGVTTGAIYVARLHRTDGDLFSRPLLAMAGQGVGRTLMTMEVPLARCYADLSRGPTGLVGWTACEILQYGGAPRVLATPLRLPLPAGATKIAVTDPLMRATSDGAAVVWAGPIAPGKARVDTRFELAVSGGRVEISIESPQAMTRIGVAIEAGKTMEITDVTGGQYQAPDFVRDQGQHGVWADYTRAGDRLHFVITGITTPTACELLQEARWSNDGNPAPAPDVVGTTRDGVTHRLSELRGKPVVLNFFASWTPPSAQEVPSLIALNRLLTPMGVTLVVIASDQTFADVDKLLPVSSGVTVWLDPSGGGGYGVGVDPHAFGTEKLPETYLIDAAGNVRHWIVNARDWAGPSAIACIQTLHDPVTGPLGAPHAEAPTAQMPVAHAPTDLVVSGRIRLGKGVKAPPGVKVGYVVVRTPGGNPPFAVDMVALDKFPVAFEITYAEAVQDAPPGAGDIDVSVVIDQDGDFATATKGDLRGTARAMIGAEGVTVTLDQLAP